MKKLFLYYSLSGNGDIVSNKLKEEKIDSYRITTRKRVLPKNFFWSMIIGGFKSMIGAKPKLNDININLDEYDLIIIGSPIWNSRLAPPINTLLCSNLIKNKKIDFILYSGSGDAKKALKKINKLFPNSKTTLLKEPKKYNFELNKLEQR